ncbi:MAG: hypothetical protein ACKV22_37350 [Bryobacteraceae bacterium]
MSGRILSLAGVAVVAAGAALAQSAGARAVVSVDKLPVFLKMSAESTQVHQLLKGDVVVIGLVMFGDDVTWCAISKLGETRRIGYVACEQLQPDKTQSNTSVPPAPAEPASATPAPAPPAAREPKAPIRIREVTPPPIPVREIEPAKVGIRGPTAREGSAPEVDPAKIRIREIEPANIRVRELPEAGTPPASSSARPPDFLALSLTRTGILTELERFIEATNLTSFLDKTRLARIDVAKLRRIASEHLQAGVIRDHIAQRVAAGYDPLRMAEVMKWLESPVARRTEMAASAISGLERRRQLSEFAEGLRTNPPGQTRLEWIHRLHTAQRVTPAEVAFTLAVVRETALALNPSLPAEMRVGPRELDPALSQVKQSYEPVMINAAIVYLLFLFRDFPDDHLRQMAEFWESEPGKWLAGAVTQGLESAAAAVGKRIGADLGSPPK